MYEAFFGFREKPFSLLPDPAFLYLGKMHSAAFSMLEYGIVNHAGFTVITGDIGCGKTTLIRHLLNNLEQDITVGLISNTHKSFGELLQWVMLAFGLEYQGSNKVKMYRAFTDFLIDEYAKNRRTVLIIDEAQNLKPKTLEELRMLSNINADKHQVLQLILAGQPELRNILRKPELVQFAQRVAVDYHLGALNREETSAYIKHRLTLAGGKPGLFTSQACELVYKSTNGIPRLINILCDTALVYGYAELRKRISEAQILAVLEDKAKSGVFASATQKPAADDSDEPEADKASVVSFDEKMARELFSYMRKK